MKHETKALLAAILGAVVIITGIFLISAGLVLSRSPNACETTVPELTESPDYVAFNYRDGTNQVELFRIIFCRESSVVAVHIPDGMTLDRSARIFFEKLVEISKRDKDAD